MKKILINSLFMICIIGMITSCIYIVIQTGNIYRVMFLQFGLKNILISFCIGVIFYGVMFYILYRIDLKVRKILKTKCQ